MLACPVCCTSFEDAERIWKQLDEIASRTRLEEAFQNMKFKARLSPYEFCISMNPYFYDIVIGLEFLKKKVHFSYKK